MHEPRPGEWISADDFTRVVCLTPLVAIDLVVRLPDDCVLLGRRTNEPAKSLLFVPGGRVTKNERLADAFRRITGEELGTKYEFKSAEFRGVFEHFYATNRFERTGFGTHYVTLAYELRLTAEPQNLPQDQHGEYFWLTPDQILARPDVHENTKAYFHENR